MSINPNCFDHMGASCVETNSGKSVQEVLDSLETDVSCLKEEQCDPCNKCEESGGSVTSTVSTTMNSLSDTGVSSKSFNIIVEPGSSSTSVQYDLREALPLGGVNNIVVEGFGLKNGVSSRLFKSNSSVGSFSGSPENFPLTLRIDVTSLSSEGQKVYKFAKSINNASSSTDEFFNVIDLSKKSANNQNDINDILDSEIVTLQNKFKSLDNINYSGRVGFNAIFTDIYSKIDNIESSNDSEINSIKSSISTINDTILDQQSQINSQNNLIQSLQSQIDIIKSTLNL